ncbi:hypothetical protein TWF281_003793 [Arthrobotrys megalospora]
MCWNVHIGTCSHPEPTPDLVANPAICTCNRYITTHEPTTCRPCHAFITELAISQAEFINIQLYNRNVTYFLQSTNEFGVKHDSLPPGIGRWGGLPNHIRFTVNDQGILMEGVGNRTLDHLLAGDGRVAAPIVPDEGDISDTTSTLVGSDTAGADDGDRNEISRTISRGPLSAIPEDQAGENA